MTTHNTVTRVRNGKVETFLSVNLRCAALPWGGDSINVLS